MEMSLSSEKNFSAKKLKKGLWVFPPNKSCNFSNSWWVETGSDPVLIDCPSFSNEVIEELKKMSYGRKATILLTNKESHGDIVDIQDQMDWPVLIQEQEAYLLPTVNRLKSFSEGHVTSSGLRLLWTPGPTPGSCVIFVPPPINVLFCGRLLIPIASNKLSVFRTKKTFHWTSYEKSVRKLRDWLPREPLPLLASGISLRPSSHAKLWSIEECDLLEESKFP